MKTGNQKFVKNTNAVVGGGLMALASKSKKPAVKKDEKETIVVTDPAVAKAIDTYVAKKAEADAAVAAMEMASGIIKEAGKKIWIESMEKTTVAKESFILASATNGTLYVVTDAYKRSNLDEERIAYLQETYGAEIIGTENKFVINPELIDKYGQVLCDFIQTSKKIADEDKESLIQLEQKNVIAKGTIKRLVEIAKKAKSTIEAVFNEIMPTVQIKVRGNK